MDRRNSTLRCPHCGAENARSLLVTICQKCKGDLSQATTEPPAPAGPAPTRARVPVQPPEPSPPVPKPTGPKPRPPRLPSIPDEPPGPPTLPEERVPPPTYQMKPIPPPLRGPSDKAYRGPSESQAVGILICLFAIVMFGIGFALLLWLSD